MSADMIYEEIDAYSGRFTPLDTDAEVAKDMAIRDARSAIDHLYEIARPEDAHWIVTTALIEADKNYRRRQNRG
jgi:hypothetical protein